MKQSIISLGTAFVALSLLVGCGKKKEVKVEKPVEMVEEIDLTAVAPEDSYVFDDSIEGVDQFAFAQDSENPGENIDDQFDIEGLEEDINQLALMDEQSSRFNKIHFDFNSDKIRNDQQEAMHKNIETAKEVAAEGKNIEVRAYRCQMGDAVYNMALSQRSANNIKKEMSSHGVPEEKIIALGCGQEKPLVSSNATERSARIEELSPNRRVEVSVH